MTTNRLQKMPTSLKIINFVLYMFMCHLSYSLEERSEFSAQTSADFVFSQAKAPRYLLYEVHPGEGFNLRRDVYMRVANLVKTLNEDEPWILVLPPWSHLYHWQSSELNQEAIPWSHFFDLDSLRKLVPIIEFTDYIKVTGQAEIEDVLYLQRYKEGWTDGKWEERMDERECLERTGFEQDESGLWRWWFWGYHDTYALNFKCLSIQAQYTSLKPYLIDTVKARSVFVLHAEMLIHGDHSEWSPVWWTARRSMRFAKELRDIGDDFRQKFLDSTDESDNTVLDEDWQNMKRQHGEAVGGPYLAVHARRKDFARSHSGTVPSIEGTATQITAYLTKYNLSTVYIATDAPTQELSQLKTLLSDYDVHHFKPTRKELERLKDGGVAVIDQWIAAHARVFLGTCPSTFSFRIHEEREILGFEPSNTFNCLCGDSTKKCEQPSKWPIKYS